LVHPGGRAGSVFLVRRFSKRRLADDRGQTVGIYIVAVSALFFLAFAYFAVGQATVTRNSAQTAADAAALAAARDYRDQVKDAFLKDLSGGDLAGLKQLLAHGVQDDGSSCGAADTYADENGAVVTDCGSTYAGFPGYTVKVRTKGTVGSSVIDSTKDTHAVAVATAVVEPRCSVDDQAIGGQQAGGQSGGGDGGDIGGGASGGGGGNGIGGAAGTNGGAGAAAGTGTPTPVETKHPIQFTCDLTSTVTVDPASTDFTLDLSDFYSVHLTTDGQPNQ
jgi:uncharacterized membrane protein YgcG